MNRPTIRAIKQVLLALETEPPGSEAFAHASALESKNRLDWYRYLIKLAEDGDNDGPRFSIDEQGNLTPLEDDK